MFFEIVQLKLPYLTIAKPESRRPNLILIWIYLICCKSEQPVNHHQHPEKKLFYNLRN